MHLRHDHHEFRASRRTPLILFILLAGDAIGSTVTDLISANQYTAYNSGGRGYVNVTVQGHYGVIVEQ